MKKEYMQPWMEVLCCSTASMVAVSGNFTDGEIINEVIIDNPIDGGNAWTREFHNIFFWEE